MFVTDRLTDKQTGVNQNVFPITMMVRDIIISFKTERVCNNYSQKKCEKIMKFIYSFLQTYLLYQKKI